MSSPSRKPTAEYDLFLDESGTFTEPSASAGRPDSRGKARTFPSQLAGVLVPRGELTDQVARELLERCHADAGLKVGGTVHASEETASADSRPTFGQYNKRITSLLNQLQERGWQPVRLLNREGVSFGGKPQTYTNMVAELFIKICKQKQREGLGRVSLRLFCAEVQVEQGPRKFRLRSEVYTWRVQERKAMIAIRQGHATESSNWELSSLEVVDARGDRRLQVCDLLSHASHDNFSWCGRKLTRPLFEKLLGAYDWTLLIREITERVEQLLEDRSLGLALIALTERLIHDEIDETLRRDARAYLGRVLDELAGTESSVRDSQLSIILSWLEQLISLQRSTALGYKLSSWLQSEVEAGLRERLSLLGADAELDWFAFALHFWALTASNHSGALFDAREESAKLDLLNYRLAGRWEHTGLLMEGLVAQAVYQTDCFDFDQASARMELVARHYENLSRLFSGAIPGIFPERIHSDLRAKALGTWMQSEYLGSASDPRRLDKARRLSEEAINEFSTSGDRERQYQYRCHLEILASDFGAARRNLAESLRLSDHSHEALANAIAALRDEPAAHAFALMHWLHLGARALLVEDSDAPLFWDAVRESGLLDGQWCSGQIPVYPAHSILRRAATVHAARGRWDRATAALDALAELDPVGKRQLVVGAIQLAGVTEVAALCWEHENRLARNLLGLSGDGAGGVKQLLGRLSEQVGDAFPFLRSTLNSWAPALDAIQSGDASYPARARLLELGRLIAY